VKKYKYNEYGKLFNKNIPFRLSIFNTNLRRLDCSACTVILLTKLHKHNERCVYIIFNIHDICS
jgi:hypothetical protein